VLVVVETSGAQPQEQTGEAIFGLILLQSLHLPKDGFDDFTTSRQAFTLGELGILARSQKRSTRRAAFAFVPSVLGAAANAASSSR